MSSDIKTGWLVDEAIEPMNTKLVRLHAEDLVEYYATKSKVFLLFGVSDMTSPGFLGSNLVDSSHNLELLDALDALATVEYLYVSGDIKIAKLVFPEEKTIKQVRKLVDEACKNIATVSIARIEAINSLQAPTI